MNAKEQEKLSEEVAILVLQSLKSFFEGTARFEVTPSLSQSGTEKVHSVRFVKD